MVHKNFNIVRVNVGLVSLCFHKYPIRANSIVPIGLTLKLTGYFATHIQVRRGGGGQSLNPPKNFETADN